MSNSNFWKIKNNSEIKECMEYLQVRPDYIKILLEKGSDFMDYLNEDPKPKYVYISSTYKVFGDEVVKSFGWFEEEDISYMKSNYYEYCGEINLRKYKLQKLNGQFR